MRDSPSAQWFHYSLWEDWHAGLYRQSIPRPEVAQQVVMLLSDVGSFRLAMSEVGMVWPVATTHNLSNEVKNHRPWLGRAAGCFRHGATIPDVNLAWSMLTFRQQHEADREADTYCQSWRSLHLRGQLRFAI